MILKLISGKNQQHAFNLGGDDHPPFEILKN